MCACEIGEERGGGEKKFLSSKRTRLIAFQETEARVRTFGRPTFDDGTVIECSTRAHFNEVARARRPLAVLFADRTDQ